MSQNFESPRLLIQRAQTHIDEFINTVRKFSSSRPYKNANFFNPFSGEQIYKVQMTGQFPPMLPAILKDCLGNMRDALDHAVYGSAVELGANDPTKTAFPFGASEDDVKRDLNKKYKDIPEKMKSYLLTFKPYSGGNDLLVSLNNLRNPTTHRIVVPLGTAHSNSIFIDSGVITSGQLGYSKWHPSTNEIEYARLGRGSKLSHAVSFEFDAVFENAQGLSGRSVGKTLNEMLTEVTRVVDAIADETGRLIASNS